MVAIWSMVAILNFFMIKVFQNKGYDVILLIHGVINKVLLRDSNYVVDVVM